MKKEKMIKDGMFFNIETSTLIGISQWYTHYKIQRQKLYKTEKGTFFMVTEQAKKGMMLGKNCPCVFLEGGGKIGIGYITVGPYSLTEGDGFRDDVLIDSVEVDSVLTEKSAKELYEYTMRGGEYRVGHYVKVKYKLLLPYTQLFGLTEA